VRRRSHWKGFFKISLVLCVCAEKVFMYLEYRTRNAIWASVTASAAMIKSPSFSRSCESRMMTNWPFSVTDTVSDSVCVLYAFCLQCDMSLNDCRHMSRDDSTRGKRTERSYHVLHRVKLQIPICC
jgi:hypothetical protein